MGALKQSEASGPKPAPATESDHWQQLAKDYDKVPVHAPGLASGGLTIGLLALLGVGGICAGLVSVSAYATLKSQMDGLQMDRARIAAEVEQLRRSRGETAGQLEAQQAELATVREQAVKAAQSREMAGKALDEAQASYAAAKQAQATAESREAAALAQLQEAQSASSKLEQSIATLRQQETGLKSSVAQLEPASANVATTLEQLGKQSKSLSEVTRQAVDARDELARLQERSAKLASEVSAAEARQLAIAKASADIATLLDAIATLFEIGLAPTSTIQAAPRSST